MPTPIIAPSLLSADFSRLREELESVSSLGADWLHLDVMDGRFVPSITFGHKLVGDLKRHSRIPFDVHLMVEGPESQVEAFAKAGADWLTFHAEASVHSHRLACRIRDLGVKAGVSIVPSTPVSSILPLLEAVDLVLVMTVDPGAGGQRMITSCVEKVGQLAAYRAERGLSYLISVDGGVNSETASLVGKADVLVAGAAVFGADDRKAAMEALRSGATGRER